MKRKHLLQHSKLCLNTFPKPSIPVFAIPPNWHLCRRHFTGITVDCIYRICIEMMFHRIITYDKRSSFIQWCAISPFQFSIEYLNSKTLMANGRVVSASLRWNEQQIVINDSSNGNRSNMKSRSEFGFLMCIAHSLRMVESIIFIRFFFVLFFPFFRFVFCPSIFFTFTKCI